MQTATDHPTADQLNAHLAGGGTVTVATYGRATVYRPKHAGMFTQGIDGNLYVARGRFRDCLTIDRGRRLLVAVRLS